MRPSLARRTELCGALTAVLEGDGEREYVNDTLSSTGLVIARSHVTPADPLTEAKTATGGSFRSDGRILVLVLKTPQVAANN